MTSDEPTSRRYDGIEDHDKGLGFDLRTLDLRRLDRRRALTVFGVGALTTLVACSSSGGEDSAGSSETTSAGSKSSTSTTSTAASGGASSNGSAECEVIPEETAGPYPGDGSNGPDVLSQSGVVRSDIRSSFGSSTTKAEGVPLRIDIDLQDAANCSPLVGAAVYVWHCDREGRYSMYSSGAEDENYLRGVQTSDSKGRVSFTSIFPGCYAGRWPHIHFEVHDDASSATSGATPRATSQIALPEDASKLVYAQNGYEQSVTNLAPLTLASDGIFADDGGVKQLGTVTGSVDKGYAVQLTVAVDRENESTGGDVMGGGPPGGMPGAGVPGGGVPGSGAPMRG